jgi:hypothetical protein
LRTFNRVRHALILPIFFYFLYNSIPGLDNAAALPTGHAAANAAAAAASSGLAPAPKIESKAVSALGAVLVTVHRARGMRIVQQIGKQDPYVGSTTLAFVNRCSPSLPH